MKKFRFLICIAFSLLSYTIFSQNSGKVAIVAFYNVENLFDTIKDPNTIDEEFLPGGPNQWTSERYHKKLKDLSEVISSIGKKEGGIVCLGVSEIENRTVLEDLIATESLKPLNLGIVHHDSPDRRGVDVGFIYRKDRFRVLSDFPHRLVMEDPNFFTRDQLLVTGILDGTDTLHILVNHWPSKRGGEKKSMPNRVAAAQLSRRIADSLMIISPNAKIIIMGDLNDNPTAKSITNFLMAKGKPADVKPGDLFNPMWKMYKDGIGSYAYRDSWDMIDQIIISYGLFNATPGSYRYHSAHVFSSTMLQTKTGPYRGYPFRTYAGGTYAGGYSDHFPVYIILQK